MGGSTREVVAHPIFRAIHPGSSFPGSHHVEFRSAWNGPPDDTPGPSRESTPIFQTPHEAANENLRRQPSLRSQLNQIRLWVRQGRTDAWIAHKLDVSIDQLERFKRDHDLEGEGATQGRPADPLSVPPPDLDLYEAVEEDEEIEAEEDGAVVEPPEAEEARPRRQSRPPRTRERDDRPPRAAEPDEDEDDEDSAPVRRPRRRGRRGGRRRRRPSSYEATFDHGEEGYGLWLDPAVVDNPIYAEHWAGHRAVVVTFDRDSITIRRANGAPADPEDDAEGPED
jgi:hypothetical protein